MDIVSILLIAVGLSMDAFAVSIASGVAGKKMASKIDTAVIMGLFFGGFQTLMPIIGWFAGNGLHYFISGFDHWIAFILLVLIGGKMIYESFRTKDEPKEKSPPVLTLGMLLLLAIATSIDALAVGLSLSFLNVSIWRPAIIVGVITFALSYVGVHTGKKVGRLFGNRVELIGGLILVGIGVKILVEHIR